MSARTRSLGFGKVDAAILRRENNAQRFIFGTEVVILWEQWFLFSAGIRIRWNIIGSYIQIITGLRAQGSGILLESCCT